MALLFINAAALSFEELISTANSSAFVTTKSITDVVGLTPSISSNSRPGGGHEFSGIASITPSLATGEDSFVLLSVTLFHKVIVIGCINTKKVLRGKEQFV
jgi:hypothetical protein